VDVQNTIPDMDPLTAFPGGRMIQSDIDAHSFGLDFMRPLPDVEE